EESARADEVGEQRVRRVLRADVRLGVDAPDRVEVIVDHVVRGVGDDETEEREREAAPARRGGAGRREQAADEARGERHREDAGPRDQEPARDRVDATPGRQVAVEYDLPPALEEPVEAGRRDRGPVGYRV